MKEITVTNQKELDDIPLDFDGFIIIKGDVTLTKARDSSYVEAYDSSYVVAYGSSHVVACGSSHVEACGSSHVVAYGSSHVVAYGSSYVEAYDSSYVEAYDSSHVVARGSSHVVAYDSSYVEAYDSSYVEAYDSSYVEAYDSSHVEARGSSYVEARGSSHVVARGSSHVVAGKWTSIHRHYRHVGEIETEGTIIMIPQITNIVDWCEYHGAKIENDIVTVFKAVRDNYKSAHDFLYSPGTSPEAPDWDGGERECGGGFHFCSNISDCLQYDCEATRFLECRISILDIRQPQENDEYPNKIKARKILSIVEVDRYGEPLNAST